MIKVNINLGLLVVALMCSCTSRENYEPVAIKLPPGFPDFRLGDDESDVMAKLDLLEARGFSHSRTRRDEYGSTDYDSYEVTGVHQFGDNFIRLALEVTVSSGQLVCVSTEYTVGSQPSREMLSAVENVLKADIDSICGLRYRALITQSEKYRESVWCCVDCTLEGRNIITYSIYYPGFSYFN